MSFPIKPLGQVLQQADLISTTQIEIALQEQTQAKNVRIGQIFASRGWLKQETADFFAEQWPTLLSQESKQPLGHYLKQAGLLNEHQIKTILYEQREMGLRFGELAVLKGWIKPTTISFFLQHLTSEPSLEQKEVRDGNSSQIQAGSPNSELAVQQKNNISESNPNHQFVSNLSWIHQDVTHLRPFIRSTIKLFKLDRKASRPEILLQKVLSWTGTQPFLTQKLCQLLCDRETFIPAGEEAARVKRLVQTRLLENWETQVAAEHLLAIRKGIVENQHCDPILLLKLYRQVLLETEIPTDHNSVQTELLNIGLVVKQENKLKVANRIYQSVFNLDWVEQELRRLRPFTNNIIKLFKLDQKASRPDILLEQVLSWTGNQPFLTQKLCQLLCDRETFIPAGEEAVRVERLVKTRLLENWEHQAAAEHLQSIRQAVLKNQYCDSIWLLRLYQQILQQGEVSIHDNSPVQTELLNLGLVVKQENKLRVANRIYQSVFNLDWVEQELGRLQPFIQNTIKLFKLDEKACFPETLLQEVLFWTGNQPFLTQKLCQLLCDRETFIPAGEEAVRVERLVKTRLLENWEHQAAAEHLQVIRQGLVENQRCNPMWLLSLYKQILQQPEVTIYDCSPVQTELLNLGLVVKQENKLRVANRIYQSVFNLDWVEQELAKWLQAPSSTITIPKSVSAKATPTTTLSEVNNLIANHRGVIFKSASILLAIAALSIVSLNIFRNQQVKNLFQQGNKLFHQGEYKKAIAKFDQLLNIDSNYYQAWTNRGYALAGLQEYNKMLESCSTATIIEPKAVYAWNCQGEALHNLKQYYEAISAFDKAIALDSQDPVFWINKTESLIALKQSDTALITIDEAIDLLQKIHQAQKVDEQQQTIRELAIAFSHKGKVLAQKQQYKEALAAYDRALIYDPRYFAAQRGRGVALQNLQRYKEAIAQFQQMLKDSRLTDTQKAETWYYLGLTFCNSSQIQDGFAALEAALKLKPDYQAAEEAKTNCSR